MNRRDFIRNLSAAFAAALVPWKLPAKAAGRILTPGDLEKLRHIPKQTIKPPICCACGEEIWNGSTLSEPPAGYAYGGSFCDPCLRKGEQADNKEGYRGFIPYDNGDLTIGLQS